MSMTIAKYERLCESGPLGSITPEDEMRMASRVHALAERYSARVRSEAALWSPQPKNRRGRGNQTPPPPPPHLDVRTKPFGIENSVPNGDR